MYVTVYPEQGPEYVPDILFEDGTYASVEDYIARMRDLDARARMILTDMRAKQARKRKPKAA